MTSRLRTTVRMATVNCRLQMSAASKRGGTGFLQDVLSCGKQRSASCWVSIVREERVLSHNGTLFEALCHTAHLFLILSPLPDFMRDSQSPLHHTVTPIILNIGRINHCSLFIAVSWRSASSRGSVIRQERIRALTTLRQKRFVTQLIYSYPLSPSTCRFHPGRIPKPVTSLNRSTDELSCAGSETRLSLLLAWECKNCIFLLQVF